jgi:hypothetical protein
MNKALTLTAILLIVTSSSASPESINILFHYHGTTDSSVIGSRVKSLGDVNNDAFDDIALNSVYPRGTYVVFGGNPADSIPDLFLRGFVDRGNPLDFTGDGIPDLVTTLLADKVLLYNGFYDSLESLPGDSISPDSGVFEFGSFIVSGIVSSDSIADLLVADRNHPGGGKLYYYENPFTTDKVADWTYELTNYSHSLFSLTLVDFNGDTSEDAIVSLNANLDSISYVYIFLGPGYSMNPDLVLMAPPEFDSLSKEEFGDEVTNVGDANGDGWADLAIEFQLNMLVYFCGPTADTIYDLVLSGGARTVSSAGDINGDSFNDIIAGDGRTLDGVVDIYLGGPLFDQYYDATIYRSDLPPLFLDRIGRALSTAGDFNNDGLVDIIFSCLNFFGGDPGDVFVVAGGPTLVTDIAEDGNTNLPTDYVLSQNFPNPFNPSTTIEFSLPTRSNVTLKILNLLGQEIAVLVNRELSVGTYKVIWDGRDKEGNDVASGVYFYKLEAGEFVETKKMVLVR